MIRHGVVSGGRLESRGVLLTSLGPERTRPVLVEALAPLGLVPPAADLPPGYPVRPHEVLHLAWQPAGRSWALVPSDLSRLFKVALRLSRALPAEERVVACRRDLGNQFVLKVFAGGKPVFKWGEDPDDDREVPYPVLANNPHALRELLAKAGLRDRERVEALVAAMDRSARDFLPELTAALGLVLVFPTLPELLANPRAPRLTLVDRDSPLAP